MRRQGLRASGSQGDFTVPVKAMHLTDAQSIQEPFDFAFITVKSYDTEWATHFIKRHVKPRRFLHLPAELLERPGHRRHRGQRPANRLHCPPISKLPCGNPGHVNRGGEPGREHGHTVFRIGEQDGRITPRVENIAPKAQLDRRCLCHRQPLGGAVVQTLPERHGQRHFRYVGAWAPGTWSRTPDVPVDPYPAGQGRG